jgi:death-on-curing protein
MKQPVFLSVDNVIYLHEDSSREEGGMAGMRDLPLLESAVLMPQQQFGGQYLHNGIPSMAAAYLFHIVSNHPFLDGNKRAGAMAAFVFLDSNGCDLVAHPADFEGMVLKTATGVMPKNEVIDWFNINSKRKSARKK